MNGIIMTASSRPALKVEAEQRLSPNHQTTAATGSSDHPRNQKLWRASVQFEAIFLEQLLAVMKKTIPDSGFLEQGFTQDVQSDMFNKAVAESIAQQSRTGIAKALYRQIEQNSPDTGAGPEATHAIRGLSDTDNIRQLQGERHAGN